MTDFKSYIVRKRTILNPFHHQVTTSDILYITW